MQQYIVIRHGSNAANQSMTPEMICGTVEAGTEEEGYAKAREEWTCYANQQFELRPASECSDEECNEAFEGDQLTAAENDHWNEVARDLGSGTTS